MNLAEWTLQPTEKKHALIRQWYLSGNWDTYEDLALSAVKELRKELQPIPAVTNVGVGGGEPLEFDAFRRILEQTLVVYTLLSESERLEFLPASFRGFSVLQVNLGDKRTAYLRTWKRLFKELKDWDEEKTLAWAEKLAEQLSGRQDPLVYHYGPIKTAITYGLVDGARKQLVGNQLVSLCGELLDLIMQPKGPNFPANLHPDTVEDYDWQLVRRRMNEIISHYVS